MTRGRWALGVDFGGTNIKVGLIGPRAASASTPWRTAIAGMRILPTRRFRSPGRFLDGVAEASAALLREAGLRRSELRGAAVGAPGPVDVRRGIVDSLVNVPGWRRVPLARLLRQRLGIPCIVDNDANLVALGEWWAGAGERAARMVCLTLGTGVGGGIVLGGRVYRGASGAAGEFGHMTVHARGRRCSCGARGCLEAEVGKAAILARARRAIRSGGAGILRRMAERAPDGLTPRLVSEAARAGDAEARRIWRESGAWFGIGVANVLNALNPDRVVIGGGVTGAWPYFAPALRGSVRSRAMPAAARAARIVRARLGNRAGILGAAMLVWERMLRKFPEEIF